MLHLWGTHIFLRTMCSGGFQTSVVPLQWRSYGRLFRRRPLLSGPIWAWAVCSHWLPAQSHRVPVPWSLPGLTRPPPPEPNSQTKLGQLTPFLWHFVPLLRGFLSWVVAVFGFYGLSTVSLTNRSIPLTESLAQLEARRKTTSEWPGTYHSSPATNRYSYWIWLTAINHPNCRQTDMN